MGQVYDTMPHTVKQLGCFRGGKGERHLRDQLSGLKEVGDVKKEFLGEGKR